MNHPEEGLQAGASFVPDPFHSAKGVLAARQALQFRRGPLLTVLGGVILTFALVAALELGRTVSFSILAGTAALATIVIAYERWRTHRHGIWAKPAGEPSLDSPLTRSVPNPKATTWATLVGLVFAGSLLAAAYRTGVAFDTVAFWIIGYGIVHMVVYTLSLWLNLGLREQALAVVWFISGGLYWVSTGASLPIVLGFGWLLTGLLLWGRLRWIEKLAIFRPDTDQSKVMP